MDAGGRGEVREIIGVGGEHPVVVGAEEHQRRVDDVGGASASEEGSGATPEDAIQGLDIHGGEQASQARLPASPSPHLADDPAVRARDALLFELSLQQRHKLAAPPFDGDEGACVEDEAHGSPPVP